MRGRRQLLDLFRGWDERSQPIPLAEIIHAVESLDLKCDDLADILGFDDACYRRTVIHSRPHYQVLLLAWRSEQRSPIHDHLGSSCVVKVLEGTASETGFRLTGCGRLAPAWLHEHHAGSVTASAGAEIHQMGNFEAAGHNMITLHVYSPPPVRWRFYRVTETTLADHDLLIQKPARTIHVELGHSPALRPLGSKIRGGLPWHR